MAEKWVPRKLYFSEDLRKFLTPTNNPLRQLPDALAFSKNSPSYSRLFQRLIIGWRYLDVANPQDRLWAMRVVTHMKRLPSRDIPQFSKFSSTEANRSWRSVGEKKGVYKVGAPTVGSGDSFRLCTWHHNWKTQVNKTYWTATLRKM